MPSKSTLALFAALAATASVSALPTRGYGHVDLYERDTGANVASGPTTGPVAQVQPPVNPANVAGTPEPVDGAIHHTHHHKPGHNKRKPSVDASGKPIVHHHHHSTDTTTQTPSTNPVVPPVANSGATLSAREYNDYFEYLVARNPPGHMPHRSHTWHAGDGEHQHPHLHSHSHIPGQHPHAHSHSHLPQQQQDPPQSQDPTAGQGDPTASPSKRELLDERGLLETLGLKARVAELTVKQTDVIKKAQTTCDGLTSKKDKKKCHKSVEKIVQLTKERNYMVGQFTKETNHHDVFPSSDPSATSSSSTPSSTTH